MATKVVKPLTRPAQPVARPGQSVARSGQQAARPGQPAARPGQPAARPGTPSSARPSAPTATGAGARKPAPPATAPTKPQGGAPTTPAKKPALGPLTFLVHSKAKGDDIGLGTLTGEYVESGKNHGKTCFKRKPPAGGDAKAPAVFLYFWDMRDGADFSGWWFGDKIGGSQVWSRCEKPDPMPPRSGWRVPWDGAVTPDLVVERAPTVKAKEEEATAAAKEEPADAEAVSASAELDERVQRATDRVVLAEIEATQALESVHAMLEGDVTEDNIKVVEELLQAQASSMTDAHKTLAADIMDARKSAPKTVAALNSLTPRVRSVQASLAQEMKQARELAAKKRQQAEELKKKAKAEAAQAQFEQRDAKALEDALPGAMEAVTAAEDSLDAVAAAASPLAVDEAEEMTPSALAAIKETEAAAAKSQEAIRAAYAKITANIKSAKDYAPEAKKVALTEYSALQEKLSEVKKKLAPLERVRKVHQAKLDCKGTLAEAARKIGAIELEAEKITGLLVGSSPSEEDVRAVESSLPALSSGLAAVSKAIEQRLQDAPASVHEALQEMRERGAAAGRRLEEFRAQLRAQLEQLEVQLVLRQCLDRTQAAEEALALAAAAEAPFLKGIDLAPGPEATEAVDALKAALRTAEARATAAKSLLRSKLSEVPRFPEASREAAVDELGQLQSRVDVVAQKLGALKHESAAREAEILLAEVTQKVADAEAKVKKTAEASAPLAPEKLEEVGIAKLKEAAEQTMEAEKSAALAFAEARKALAAKQREAQTKDSPGYAAELVKLQGRLTAMQQELGRQRKVAVQGERLWKSTQVLQEREAQVKHVEAEVDKAELLTTPLGDERPSNESVMEMDKTVNAVQALLVEITDSLQVAQQGAKGTLAAQLAQLLARAKKCQGKIDEMKATTKEQRERAQCQAILAEAREKLNAVDSAFTKAREAEEPYLKGMELLPLDEATKAVADCEAAASAIQKALSEARGFFVQKSQEVRGFTETVARSGAQELEALGRRAEEAKGKLMDFVREMDGRKRIAHEQQAQAKVTEAEEAVQRAVLAAAPLAEKAAEESSPEAAQELLDKHSQAEQEAQERIESSRRFLLEKSRVHRARMETATVSKLVGRLNAAQADLTKAKEVASEHEQRFIGRLVLQEASDLVKTFEAEVEQAIEAAAPLVAEGGKSFVAASMARMVMEMLGQHCQKGGVSQEDLFAKVGPGAAAGKAPEAEFVAFLERVPELCSRSDLAFSAEQRRAIFEQLDGDKDGAISKADFLELFRDRYICTQEVPLTDGLDLAQSKTLDTLLVDDVVECLGEQKSLDTLGLIRMEVRVLKDGSTGWVTTQDGQGVANFSPFTAYTSFVKRLDRTLSSTQATSSKASSFLSEKAAELRECQQGPLAETKAALAELRPKANILRGRLDQLQKKVDECKKEHSRREELERRRQGEKKDREAAALVLAAVHEATEAVQEALRGLELAVAPFSSSAEQDLSSLGEPLTLQGKATEAAGGVERAIAEARSRLKASEGRVVKAAKGPWHEARQELAKQRQSLDAAERRRGELLEVVETGCGALAEAKGGQVSAALRSLLQARQISVDKLFAELAGADGEQISEAAFGRCLAGLKEAALTEEQRRLLFQRSGPDGVGRRAFLALVERYFRCAKEITVTSDFDIKASSTLRKLEPGEYVEVLEGPRTDSSVNVTRIRARALSDGTTGWVTAKGNQGTPFLTECPKPCYAATEELSLQDAFSSDACGDVRVVRPGEVLEVLEGPRREVLGSALRARGKATTDGATGWFTVRSRQGAEAVRSGSSTFTCRQGIALTSEASIKDCKVLRKLDRGEVITMLEGPVEDEAAGVTRIRAKASRDDMEGWVTTKGNAGSVYLEESGRTVVVVSSMPLQTKFKSEAGSDVRMLAEGESVEVLEGPTEEKTDAALRVQVRAVLDGATGWVALREGATQTWSSSYTVVAEAVLTDVLDSACGKAVRALELGEAVELLEGPKEDRAAGVLRLRGRAERDGAIGWATVVEADGRPLLECVPTA